MENADIVPAPPSTTAQARSGLRHASRWIGLPIAAVLAVASVTSLVTSIWFETTQKDKVLDSLQGVYTDDTVVCSAGTAACAARAARRAGRTLAWLPDADGFETHAFGVIESTAGARYAFQEGRRSDALVTVDTGPSPGTEAGRGRETGTIDLPGGFRGALWQDDGQDGQSAEVRWTDGSRDFRLLVTVPFGDGSDAARVVRNVVDEIRYATTV